MLCRTEKLLFLFLLGAAAALAAPHAAISNPDRLDQKKIHAEYNDGNFDKVVASLEGFMAAHKTYGFEDSVFIAKHLAVVYTANPDTREKGKYYMYRLLALLPSAKLVDMYVSDEIDRIFDKVREEFMTRQRNFGVDTSRVALAEKAPAGSRGKETPPAAQPAPKLESHTGLWIAGGAAVVAVGATAFYIFHQTGDATSSDHVYHVP